MEGIKPFYLLIYLEFTKGYYLYMLDKILPYIGMYHS